MNNMGNLGKFQSSKEYSASLQCCSTLIYKDKETEVYRKEAMPIMDMVN